MLQLNHTSRVLNNRCSLWPGIHTTTVNNFSVSYDCLLKAFAFVIHIVYGAMLVKHTSEL